MVATDPLVWLPFDPAELGEPPSGLRYEVAVPDRSGSVPNSVGEVAFYVPPYRFAHHDYDFIDRAPALQVVQTLTAGVEHVQPLVPPHVTLCNGRGIHDSSTAELAVALILASLRGIPDFVRAQDRGVWSGQWRPALADTSVLIVGAGSIAHALATRLEPFEVSVAMVGRTARAGVHAVSELPALLPSYDVVVLLAPATDETRGMVNAEFLGQMKDGALLVNVARGALVVTADLIAALESGRISAALDVTDPEPLPEGHPLWRAPNLLISPHVGGPSSAMWPRAYRLVREQLQRFANGQPLHNVVGAASVGP